MALQSHRHEPHASAVDDLAFMAKGKFALVARDLSLPRGDGLERLTTPPPN
jgi:hypothetical protein